MTSSVKATIVLLLMWLPACQAKREAPREAPREEVEPPPQVSRMEVGSARPEQRAPLPLLPDSLPGVRKDMTATVGTALRAAIGDLDGDGDRELVLIDSQRLRVLDASGKEVASLPVTRGIQTLVIADVDGDGAAEVFAGWGITRDHMGTKAAFTVHRLEGGTLTEETVLAPETSRNDTVAIVPMLDARSVLVAYFDSKYNVSSVVAKRGASGWETTKLASLRTATSYARGDVDGDGAPDLVVGRVYGEDKGSDGDAFVLRPDGARTRIPSTRGMRSVIALDSDGDGRVEVFMGDGWHQNYGANARGLVTRATWVAGEFKTELVENTPGQYAIEKLILATIDGGPAIVAMGSHYVRVYQRDGKGWRAITVAGAARDVAVGDMDGVAGDELLIIAEKSELVSLREVPWQPVRASD